jgi:hypothetical protein
LLDTVAKQGHVDPCKIARLGEQLDIVGIVGCFGRRPCTCGNRGAIVPSSIHKMAGVGGCPPNEKHGPFLCHADFPVSVRGGMPDQKLGQDRDVRTDDDPSFRA